MAPFPAARTRPATRVDAPEDPFDRLLTLLHPDRDTAGQRYEDIRWGLRTFFTRRGVAFADEMADETMDRVGRRLAAGERIHSADPALYFYGVARNVLRESWTRGVRSLSIGLPGYEPRRLVVNPPPDPEEDVQARRLECLQRCLGVLPPDERRLALDYYQASTRAGEARRSLAAALGVGVPTLRVRMHRLRDRLEHCTRGCLATRCPLP
jgi:DNA-directed RNA polymerase specialized sigma24 family protein